MLYSLFQYLDERFDLPGSGMFQYISFRSAVAVILALLITILFGRSIIRMLQRHQIGEEIRDLGLEGQLSKRGTPTMGGVIILLAILVPILLVGRLDNVYLFVFRSCFRSQDIIFVDIYQDELTEANKIRSGLKLVGNTVLTSPNYKNNFPYIIRCINTYGFNTTINQQNISTQFVLEFENVITSEYNWD